MTKKRNYFILVFIFLLAFFTINFSYPKYLNKLIDYINHLQLSLFNFKLTLPSFPDIPFRLGLDLQGGSHLVYEADLSQIKDEEKNDTMAGLRDIIERRANLFGVQESIVQVQGHRLIVELPGIIDPAQAIEEIGKTPFLDFREQRPDEEEVKKIIEKRKEIQGKSFEEIIKTENWNLAYEEIYLPTQLTGKYLKRAELSFHPTTYQPMVSLEFNEEGAKIFEELTEKNIGKPLAIYIDNQLISDPIVQEKISGGKAQITGSFTVEYARQLARNLNAGALPVPIKIVSQQNVGPTLGENSLKMSLRAGIFGFLTIVLFMIIFYRLPGFLASIALIIYISILLTIFKLIPVTLTLAGIAGFILSIGMAVDANILVFARMREELKLRKNFSISLQEGFRRAWPSIRDGSITTLIVTLILFSFGSSFVKGFAFTLSLGIIVSIFSAIIITKTFLKIFEGTKLENFFWLWR